LKQLLRVAACALCLAPWAARAESPSARRLSESELPSELRPAGQLVTALAWTDTAGENVAAFWRRLDENKGRARLQVDLWSRKPGKPGALLRSVKDAVLDCEFDLVAEFVDAALGVSDLDGDGIGELTFAYRTTCTSDVSPLSLKLLVLEQRDKFIVRGSTRVDVGGGQLVGGEKKADPALKRQPKVLAHANAVWAEIVGP
jgi:hypothetical protein